MKKQKIELIIGPSCSGKSSLIKEREGLGSKVLMAYELEKKPLKNFNADSLIIHYNSFRSYQNVPDNSDVSILSDSVLKSIINSDAEITITVLVCSATNLIKRAALRERVEPDLREKTAAYRNENVLELLNLIDLKDHYKSLIGLFMGKSLEVNIFDTNEGVKPMLNNDASFENALSFIRSDYTEQEIDNIIQKYHFEYHSINLPHSRKTKGDSRNFDYLTEVDINNKTVLDIGCGYGSSCFYAESRSASFVSGTELKKHRYIGAIVAKNILNSNIEIREKNLFSGTPNVERYDIVLLLNVIHHLPEPFKAINDICEMTKEKFVIEFPTLSDPKFLATLPKGAKIDHNLPLVGISTKSKDQTFVFSVASLTRFMDQNHKDFSIEIVSSKIAKSRKIMIATRK